MIEKPRVFFPDELVADGCLPPDGWVRDDTRHGWVNPAEVSRVDLSGSTHTHLCRSYEGTVCAGRNVVFLPNFFLGRWYLVVNDYARSITFCPWCGVKLEDPEVRRGG